MANNYLAFSFVAARDITPEEKKWWEDNTDFEKIEAAGFPEPFQEEYVGFDIEFTDGGEAIIFAEESGDPEQVAILCQDFLRAFRPREKISFEWAYYCSKARVGEFGGGGVLISANRQCWLNTGSMLDKLFEGDGWDLPYDGFVHVVDYED
jgi:hypothetical protein